MWERCKYVVQREKARGCKTGAKRARARILTQLTHHLEDLDAQLTIALRLDASAEFCGAYGLGCEVVCVCARVVYWRRPAAPSRGSCCARVAQGAGGVGKRVALCLTRARAMRMRLVIPGMRNHVLREK